MMKQADNEALTRVGPGTPGGELLRRYWHPVSMAAELTEEKPIKSVTLLNEKLVVFRMPPAAGETQPRYGMMAEQCPHRLASLAYGRVDAEGIRCPYHGWKFNTQGQCIEQPAEPLESTYKNEILQPAYPVEKLAGILFAYMGPLPAPLLPRWDALVRTDGRRWVQVQSVIHCNWVQPMENSVDSSHVFWLHHFNDRNFDSTRLGNRGEAYIEEHEFIRFEYGIMKCRTSGGKTPDDPPLRDEHPLVFPTILRNVRRDKDNKEDFQHYIEMRAPIDDTHTQRYSVNFIPSDTITTSPDEDPPHRYFALKDPEGKFYMQHIPSQDAMAWETQGALADRSKEHLGASDRGVLVFRKLLREQIDIVRAGGEPMGIVRDPVKNEVIHFDVFNEGIGLPRTNAALKKV